MERVDGTQARLKRKIFHCSYRYSLSSGKGGWDSGEIETPQESRRKAMHTEVERVDGTQARLKPQARLLDRTG